MFYVTDLTGTKIVNATRQATIRRHLLDVLHGREAGKDGVRDGARETPGATPPAKAAKAVSR